MSAKKPKNPHSEPGERILAEGYIVSNDTTVTDLNNNDLIIGPSGAGKTMGYVKPNIRKLIDDNLPISMIVADTKSSLFNELKDELESSGFDARKIDFVKPEETTATYNPLKYIGRDKDGQFRQQDIMTVAYALLPPGRDEDSFWVDSARNVLVCLISFLLEAFPDDNPNLSKVAALYDLMRYQIARQRGKPKITVPFLEDWAHENQDSFAVKKYRMFSDVICSDKTWGSIMMFLTNALSPFEFREAENLFMKPGDFKIEQLGSKKTVLFLNISDSDRTFDHLINLFYTQALQALMKKADEQEYNRLEVPVRIILDDFAANAVIPDFDKTISVSIILQSLTQLQSMYSHSKAMTIVNNCDHVIYLGGSDEETARFISLKADKSVQTILNLPLDKVWILERGKKGVLRYKYSKSPESDKQENPVTEKAPAAKKASAGKKSPAGKSSKK